MPRFPFGLIFGQRLQDLIAYQEFFLLQKIFQTLFIVIIGHEYTLDADYVG